MIRNRISYRAQSVILSVVVLGAVFALLVACTAGCKNLGPWIERGAAATTQATANAYVQAAVDPFPWGKIALGFVGMIATAILGHMNGQRVAKNSAASSMNSSDGAGNTSGV